MDASMTRAGDHERPLPDSVADAMKRIEEQGRQTLELVRALVRLLTPIEGGRDGPRLEDLLAALIAQQREIIEVALAIQDGVNGLPEAVAETLLARMGHEAVGRA